MDIKIRIITTDGCDITLQEFGSGLRSLSSVPELKVLQGKQKLVCLDYHGVFDIYKNPQELADKDVVIISYQDHATRPLDAKKRVKAMEACVKSNFAKIVIIVYNKDKSCRTKFSKGWVVNELYTNFNIGKILFVDDNPDNVECVGSIGNESIQSVLLHGKERERPDNLKQLVESFWLGDKYVKPAAPVIKLDLVQDMKKAKAEKAKIDKEKAKQLRKEAKKLTARADELDKEAEEALESLGIDDVSAAASGKTSTVDQNGFEYKYLKYKNKYLNLLHNIH